MHRLLLPLFRFFHRHLWVMYLTLIGSALVFLFFGLKLQFEEDIVKLLPRSSTDNELAFSDIDLKEKVFIQITSRDTTQDVSPSRLGEAIEEYCTMVNERDEDTRYFAGSFYALEEDIAFGAMDFGLSHLPSFVDTAWYGAIEASLQKEAIEAQMAENYEMMMEDETGTITQLITMDPLGLRNVVLGSLFGDDGSMGGFTIDEGHLFCPDKTVVLAFLSPGFSYTDSGKATRMIQLLKDCRKDFEAANPDVRVLIHGNPLGSVSNAGTIKGDLVLTVGLSLLIILVIIVLSFHNFTFIWQQILPIAYGTVFALACMYWIKGVMSLMALGLGAIVLGVAISYCLHVLIHFYYVKNVEKMLIDESTPVVLGCITTVGAFLGLLFTESELLRDFGLFATFALVGNTFFALVFLPHFLHRRQIKYKHKHGFPLIERINNLPWDRNKWVIGTLLVLIAVGVCFSPFVKFDSDLRNLDYDDPELVESQNLYNTKNADGFDHQYFAAWSQDNLDEALTYNDALFRRLDSLQADGIVKGWSPVTGLLFHSQQDQQMRIDSWKAFWSKDRIRELRANLSAAARAYDLDPALFDPFLNLVTADYEPGNLYESGIIPPGLLSNYIEKQKSGRYMVFTDVAYPHEQTDVVWGGLAKLPHVIVLEPFFYCRDMVEIVHDDFSTTLWISSLLVLIVLLVSFHNIWIALIAFLPMFISWYVMQGYMAIFGLEFNLINIVISTFIYGIGVDYSIFVMEGLLKEARTGEKDMLSFHKVAIFFSALVLAIVTFSLIFARHPAIQSIGMITLIGMASTILITYSLQPWLFRILCRIPFFRRGFHLPPEV